MDFESYFRLYAKMWTIIITIAIIASFGLGGLVVYLIMKQDFLTPATEICCRGFFISLLFFPET